MTKALKHLRNQDLQTAGVYEDQSPKQEGETQEVTLPDATAALMWEDEQEAEDEEGQSQLADTMVRADENNNNSESGKSEPKRRRKVYIPFERLRKAGSKAALGHRRGTSLSLSSHARHHYQPITMSRDRGCGKNCMNKKKKNIKKQNDILSDTNGFDSDEYRDV